MKRLVILFFVIVTPIFHLYADDFTDKIIQARSLLDQGYYQWNEALMQESLAQFQRLLHLEQQEWLVHFYIAFTEYRLSTFYINNDKKKMGQLISDALDHLKKSEELNDTFPETYSLISLCYGYEMYLAPWKSIFLGGRAGLTTNKAISLGPENPRVWFSKGLNSYYTPKIFGGGKEVAFTELKKSTQLYKNEKPLDPIHPQWGHDEAYAWLGTILKERGQLLEAKQAFENGLEINPQNGWIQYTLLPELMKELEPE